MAKRAYTPGEEVVNAVTHAVGVGLGIAGLALLVTLAATRGDPWRVVSFSVYGATLILLYLASTLYHGVLSPRWKEIFHRLDHAAIFLLIAGTYTPFTLVTLRGPWGWALFGVIWGLAILGLVLKLVFLGRWRLGSVAIYILMGWIIMVAVGPLLDRLPAAGLAWLAIGGVCYTGGVAFYAWKSLPYGHALWHLFVLAGTTVYPVDLDAGAVDMAGAFAVQDGTDWIYVTSFSGEVIDESVDKGDAVLNPEDAGTDI